VVLVLFSCQYLDCPEELMGAMHLCRIDMDVKNWRFVVKCFFKKWQEKPLKHHFFTFKKLLRKIANMSNFNIKTKKTIWLAGD